MDAERRECLLQFGRLRDNPIFCGRSCNRHREELLGKLPFGLRTINKLAEGTDQRGFRGAPIQLMIAVSDGGKIKRIGGWKEPSEPFRVFVTKADLVPDKIAQELARHRKGASILNTEPAGEYGMWSMKPPEVELVAQFLTARHVGRPDSSAGQRNRTTPQNRNRKSSQNKAVSTRQPVKAICKYCGSSDLTARSGKYGYYWRCGSCKKNTSMAAECSSCGAKRRQNGGVQVRKDKSTYFRECEACGTSEVVWVEG